MKRRLMIARGLVHDPKLLMLDEPTAGVDIEIRRDMWAFLQEINAQGVTIILTTHYLEEAEQLCKDVAIINHGEIITQSSVKDLITTLNYETIILDLKSPIHHLPEIEGFNFNFIDDLTTEVKFCRNVSLNHLFNTLTEIGCEVVSFRNKANRLEELFLDLVKPNLSEDIK